MQTLSTLGDVEPYQQITNYSCGAATLKAVMKHYGDDVDEPTLMREVGVDPTSGSTATQVASAARGRGYRAVTRTFRSVDELAVYTERDTPVIIAVRSFNNPRQGHFVVATKVRGDRIKLMDPNTKGNQRVIGRTELDRRWRFRDRVGVVITPTRRSAQFGGAGLGAFTKKQIFGMVAAGVVAIGSAVTAGVMIYRRRAN